MSNYRFLLNNSYELAEKHNISFETFRLFLFELCNEKNIDLFLEMENEVDLEVLAKFENGVPRLLNHEPLGHILGYSYFNGNKLIVNNDVLIPRYETEELVMNILIESDNYFKENKDLTVSDIGSGSGAIAISLLKEENKIKKMYATDISEKALEVAKKNAELNEVDIEFLLGDMLQPLIEKNIKLDILISNPPYIPEKEDLDVSVKNFEPKIALFGGDDGLAYYRSILSNAYKVLKTKAMICFEIGYNQKESLEKLTNEYLKNYEFNCIKDINGKDRIVIIKLNKE